MNCEQHINRVIVKIRRLTPEEQIRVEGWLCFFASDPIRRYWFHYAKEAADGVVNCIGVDRVYVIGAAG